MHPDNTHSIRNARGFRLAAWILFGIAAAIVFALLFAVLATFLWNRLMPEIFGLTVINYWQAFGLILLARLLVGGWHHGGHTNHRHASSHRLFRKINPAAADDPDEIIRENRKQFSEYWDSEGRKGFEEYMKRTARADERDRTKA